MFKKITGILLAVLMMSTICCQAVELSYSVVVSDDNFDSYTVNSALPCGTGEKWEKSTNAPAWNAKVVKPSRRGPQYVEIEKPNATVEADSYTLMTPKLGVGAVLTGDVDVSFKIYIPSLGTAPSGEAYNPRQTDYAVNIVAVNGEENDLLGDSFKLWTHHTGDVPKISVGQTFYELSWNTWHEVRLVFNSDDETVSFYLDNDTNTPTATQTITESYNISYVGFRLDKNLPETKIGLDDFYMVHSNTEVIDESSMTISYIPVYDGETRTLTIDGTARPHFDQNAQAAIYDPADTTVPLASAEVATTEGGAFSIALAVPVGVSGKVLLDVSSDYLPTDAAGRKMEILIYDGAADASLAADFATMSADKESAILMLDTYLPLAVSRPTWFAYLENKDYYAEYIVANAADEMVITQTSQLADAIAGADKIAELNNADESEIVSLLGRNGYLPTLTAAQSTEFSRVWAANALTEDFVIEKDVKERVEEILAVTLVNCAKRSEISGIIKDYQSVFGLTDEEIAPEDVDFDIVCAALFSKGYVYTEDVAEALRASIEYQLSQPVKRPSSGGGGGGGGGRVNVSADIIDTKPAVAPETKEEEKTEPDVKEEDKTEVEDKTEDTKVSFGDIEEHWAKDSILALCEQKVINGYEDGTFKPENKVNRAEYIAMAVRLAGLSGGEASFSDVKADAWYAAVIGAAYKAGIITGSDNCIYPENTITRQDAAVILYRLLGEPEADGETIAFEDADDIAEYAKKAVEVLSSMGIINGADGKFAPQREISRAETAKILFAAADKLN